jgi:retron-type reverse transcriptase
MDLPVFSNVNELAQIMHIHPGFLTVLGYRSDKFYKRYKIKKSDGSKRLIMQPSSELKAIQAWILRNILEKLQPSRYATAYIKGFGLSENTKFHNNNRYFICLDLEEFFPSISFRRIMNLFSLIGYSRTAAYFFTNLTTCDNILPQGGVTSPCISNLIASKLDRRIAGFTSRRNISYSRYADDMTISSNNPIILIKSFDIIEKIINSEHFSLNRKKIRVMGPRRKCYITGLIKNNSGSSFGIGKKKKRDMRRIMHHHIYNKSIDKKYKNEQSILGWLGFLKSVDESSFNQMSKYWEELKSNRNNNC